MRYILSANGLTDEQESELYLHIRSVVDDPHYENKIEMIRQNTEE